jgi:AraC-like DNA-binding protein
MEAIYNEAKNRFELLGDYFLRTTQSERYCTPHTHSYIELVYHFSGSAEHFVDGVSYTVRRGDILIVDKGCEHSFFPKPRVRYCDIMLKPEFFDESLRGGGIISFLSLGEFNMFSAEIQGGRRLVHLSESDRKSVETLIKLTIDEQSNTRTASKQMRHSALNMLMTLIFRSMSSSARLSLNSELLNYIKSNCALKLTLSSLADRCGYTVEHFSRKFHALAGKTFTDFLTECRLMRAAELLINTHKTVDAIIEESGFSSRGEFFRKFREKFGETPLKFKKSQKLVL